MTTLGWIGIGDIGLPMLEKLVQAGHTVQVWARHRERLDAAVRASGARPAASAAALGAACDAVFLCVNRAEAVEEIVFGEHGIASASKAGTLVVDHSTIHPGQTRAMAERLQAMGSGRWVDAPVSGGAVGARAGTLAVMAGGAEHDVATATPWMRAYGGRITHVGGVGTGQACKSCNQAIANTTIMVWAEMLAYAQGCGLDLARLFEATEGGFADSQVRRVLVPRIVSGEYPGHYASLIPKDLDIPCDMARMLQAPLPVTSLVTNLYRHHQVLQEMSGGDPVGLMRLFQRAPKDAGGAPKGP